MCLQSNVDDGKKASDLPGELKARPPCEDMEPFQSSVRCEPFQEVASAFGRMGCGMAGFESVQTEAQQSECSYS